MEEILSRLNPWWGEKYHIDAVLRESYINELMSSLEKGMVLFLTGMRRVGKTTLIKCVIEKLQGLVQPSHILFAPLDHPFFADKGITQIVESFREINKIPFKERIYLFFDEIQSKESFEQELKSLSDNENVRIVCSGSQSLLLRDKKARLTGRTKTIHINPLDFEEFLKFSNVSVGKSDRHLYAGYFEKYLETGGIPEYVLEKDPGYIIELVDAIITKDIVAYHGLKNAKIIRELFQLLCERAGKRLSLNKISRILSLNVESLRQYISFFEDCFLIHTVYRHAKTLNERIKSNRKIYIADVGIRNVISGFKDRGAVFENLVFLKIKDKGPFYYFDGNREIDFVFKDTAIECKYKENVSKKELEVLNKSKFKNKLVVKDYSFFIGTNEKGIATKK